MGALADRFELGETLGEGGSAAVYRAVDRATGALVALKVYAGDDDSRARLHREIAALRAVRHPGLPALVAEGATSSGAPFVAMTLCEGAPLSSHLRAPWSNRRLRALGLAVCDPLAALHAAGFVHRDIKPEHILIRLDARGELASVVLVDLGLALEPSDARRITGERIVGTLGFLPPEQLRASDAPAEPAWDVFSLGCVLFFAAAGSSAFAAPDDGQLVAKVLSAYRPPLRELAPHVDPALAALIDSMIALSPSERPRDATAVRDALRAITTREDEREPTAASSVIALIVGHPAVAMTDAERMDAATGDLTGTPAKLAIDPAILPSDAWVETAADGSILVCLRAASLDAKFVARAVQCALLLAARRSGHRWAVAASAGALERRWPRGAAVDRALALRHHAVADAVVIESLTALVASERFVLEARGPCFIVLRAK
ncbi:MAG: serine/threonine protein kinase [Myxococcales bacterium]|nr:serine/threonine protein kinase [Myxococcales bacterium]